MLQKGHRGLYVDSDVIMASQVKCERAGARRTRRLSMSRLLSSPGNDTTMFNRPSFFPRRSVHKAHCLHCIMKWFTICTYKTPAFPWVPNSRYRRFSSLRIHPSAESVVDRQCCFNILYRVGRNLGILGVRALFLPPHISHHVYNTRPTPPSKMPGLGKQQQHVSVSSIFGVPIYPVDNPSSGCSAGFWESQEPWSVEIVRDEDGARRICARRETRIELDFQHADPNRCQCLGKDTDSPAVRELLDVALGFTAGPVPEAPRAQQAVAETTTAAMLVLLGRVLQLPALGDADLDLWGEVYWPPPPPPAVPSCDGKCAKGSDGRKCRLVSSWPVKTKSKTSFLKKPSRCLRALRQRLRKYIPGE